MCTISRSKIRKLIKQHKKGYLRNCIIAINLDAIPDFKFDTKYWIEMLYQRGVMLMDSEHESVKIIKFKPRRL